MKNFLAICYFSVIIFGSLASVGNSFFIFPVDLIRIVTTLPSTPNISTPELGWAMIWFVASIIVLGLYIGLPRQPPPQSLRRLFKTSGRKQSPDDQQFDIYFKAILNAIYELDCNKCLARFLCHTGTMNPTQMNIMQTIMLSFFTSMYIRSPYVNDSSFNSLWPTKTLIDAVQFGQSTKCWDCCVARYNSCTLQASQLLFV
ncbi:hypothetical protein CHUAL_010902 [Chamberlinius hualienensis]